MGKTRQVYKAGIRYSQHNNIPRPQFEQAVEEAQRENARIVRDYARSLARQRVKNSPSVDNRGKRRYAGTMAESYLTRPTGGGLSFSLTNRTVRGRIFEVGSPAHRIPAKRGEYVYFRRPKVGGRLHRRYREARHPGQRANPVMGDAMYQMDAAMAINIMTAVERQM